VCRRIEGEISVTDFAQLADTRLRVLRHTRIGPSTLTELTEGKTIHVVQNIGSQDAIDLHFCSKRGDGMALRYEALWEKSTFSVGEELEVTTYPDHLPVVLSTLDD